MSLEISSIHNQGNAAEEYIRLEVTADCNLMSFAIADTTYTDNGAVSNVWRHFHRFLGGDAVKGDIVLLHTGKGNDSERAWANPEQKQVTIHTRYWGFDEPILGDSRECVALYRISFEGVKRKGSRQATGLNSAC